MPNLEDMVDDVLDDDEDEDFSLEQSLAELLDVATVATIRAIAKRRGIKLKGTGKEGLITQLVDALAVMVRDETFDHWAGLTTDERELVQAMYLLHGSYNRLSLSKFNYVWQKVLQRKGTAVAVVNNLELHGFFIKLAAPGSDIYYDTLLPLPAQNLTFRPLVAPKSKSTPQKPLVPTFPAPSLLSQLERLAYYLATGAQLATHPFDSNKVIVPDLLPPQKREPWMFGDWPIAKEDIDKIIKAFPFTQMHLGQNFFSTLPVLHVPWRTYQVSLESFTAVQNIVSDRRTLEWLVTALLQLGIATLSSEGHINLRHDVWGQFTALNEAQKLTLLFNVWSEMWGDLYEIRAFLQETPQGSVWRRPMAGINIDVFAQQFIFARQYLLRHLQALVQNEEMAFAWYDLLRFNQQALQIAPHVYNPLFQDDGLFGVAIKGKQVNPTHKESQTWSVAWLEMQFTEVLYWLGMVDLAVQEGKVQAFRLTPLGAHLLQPRRYPYSTEAAPEGSAEWQADGTSIKINPGVGMNQLRGLVSRVAVPVTGQADVYRLGGAGLESGFLQGDAPALLATQFAELGYPLPEPAQAYLAQVYARFGRVHLYEGVTVVEFTDDTAVAELRAANLLPSNTILAQLSPRLIVITEPFAQTLYQNLEQKGYTPRIVTRAD